MIILSSERKQHINKIYWGEDKINTMTDGIN